MERKLAIGVYIDPRAFDAIFQKFIRKNQEMSGVKDRNLKRF